MKKWMAFLLTAVMAVGMAACGGKEPAGTESAGVQGSEGSETTADPAAGDGENGAYRVLIGSSNMSGSFYSWLSNTCQKSLEELGVEASIIDLKSDSANVPSLIEMAVSGGYNGLVIDKPDHEQDTDALLKEAAEAGVYTVLVNNTAGDDGVSCYVGLDNYTLGYCIGTAAAGMIPQNAKGLILKATAGNTGSEDRYNGWMDAMKDAGRDDIEILDTKNSKDWSKEGAMAIMEDWTQMYSDFDFVYSLCDDMVCGCIEVCGAADFDTQKIQFFGIDGLANGCNAVKAGTMTATVLQNADDMGKVTAEALVEMMSGKDTSSRKFALDGTVITSENVDEIIAMHEANGMMQ